MTANQERNDEIIAAVKTGESKELIGERFGLTGERVRQIARAAGIANNGSHPTRCGKCGQRLEQQTDGNGQVIDICPVHGRNIEPIAAASAETKTQPVHKKPRRSYVPSPHPRRKRTLSKSSLAHSAKTRIAETNGKAPVSCDVEGCPGFLNKSGACECCERRQAYEQSPARKCGICQGPTQSSNYCPACEPVRYRVYRRAT